VIPAPSSWGARRESFPSWARADAPGRALSLTEIDDLLDADPSRVHAWVRDGDVPSMRTGTGTVRVEPDDLVRFLESRGVLEPSGLRALARRRVLIIEGDATQWSARRRGFERFGERIAVAFDADVWVGLISAAAWRPHVLVVDVDQSGLNGAKVCRRLRRYRKTASIVVVLASARLTPELVTTGTAAGAARVVAKPVDAAELAALPLTCTPQPQRAP
jgi:CheY-like chemotaxis protein